MSEFDIIEKYFAQLTQGAEGAFQLKDDVALTQSNEFAISKDLLISGVHFLPKDPMDLVARKALRVNLSDLAAKGARPYGYFLGCVWPATISEKDIALFVRGLNEDQNEFRIPLLGGDTTKHVSKSGPLTISVTMLGVPPQRGIVHRHGAELGDDIYVSGTIGDAGLGLAALKKEFTPTTIDKAALAGRFHLPTPRLTLGGALVGLATSSIDVSDGLIADAGHLASCSGLRAEIVATSMPRSTAANSWMVTQDVRWRALHRLATSGDDYEILFTAPPALRRSVVMAASASRTEVTRIGEMKKGAGVDLLKDNGEMIALPQSGFDHFR